MSFTKCLYLLPTSPILVLKTGNGIIQTDNGIIAPTFLCLLQNVSNFYWGKTSKKPGLSNDIDQKGGWGRYHAKISISWNPVLDLLAKLTNILKKTFLNWCHELG